MFLHATKQGQEEVERLIWWGHWQSLPRPNPEADVPTIKLVGYQTSHKEIRDLYHIIYLLRRLPGPPPCGPWQRKEAIWDILSFLRNWLHRWGYPATSKEDAPEPAAEPQSRPRRRENLHGEALWEAREAHQWALKVAYALESDIERLSQQAGMHKTPHSHSRSSSWPWSQSLDRHPRSSSRYWLDRRVTFWELEIEPDPSERHSFEIHPECSNGAPLLAWRQETVHPPETPMVYPDAGGREDYLPEPSIKDIETWLDWWAHQMDMPYWWAELTAILEVENPKRLAQKICTSFSILTIRYEAFPGQGYTVPPVPRCITRNLFLPNDLSYQDVWQQPLLLTVAYAPALQYWVEKFRPPRLLPFDNECHGTDAKCEEEHCLLQMRCPPGPEENCPWNCKLGPSSSPRAPHHPSHCYWHHMHGVKLWKPLSARCYSINIQNSAWGGDSSSWVYCLTYCG